MDKSKQKIRTIKKKKELSIRKADKRLKSKGMMMILSNKIQKRLFLPKNKRNRKNNMDFHPKMRTIDLFYTNSNNI